MTTAKKKVYKKTSSTKPYSKLRTITHENCVPQNVRDDFMISEQLHSDPSNSSTEKNPTAPDANIPSNSKTNVISRALLRLYHYLHDNQPFDETALLAELEFNTDTAILREEIHQKELELEAIYEENHALRQNVLNVQIEMEEKLNSVQFENSELKEKLNKIDTLIHTELDTQASKYESIIEDLKTQLRKAHEQGQKYSEVNEAVKSLQAQILQLYDQNDKLTKTNQAYERDIAEHIKQNTHLATALKKNEKELKELQKKIDLQTMVIDSYKRKEK